MKQTETILILSAAAIAIAGIGYSVGLKKGKKAISSFDGFSSDKSPGDVILSGVYPKGGHPRPLEQCKNGWVYSPALRMWCCTSEIKDVLPNGQVIRRNVSKCI